MAYNLGAAPFEVEASVVDAGGRPAASGRLAGVERTVTGMAGVDKFVADFEPGGLAAGDYELRLALTRNDIDLGPADALGGGDEIAAVAGIA